MQVLAVKASGFQLLLPVNMVAQITGKLPVQPGNLGIPGAAGLIQWREFNLPLFRTSELFGGKESDDDSYERVVVLWPMKSAGTHSFIALTSLGPPRVVDVSGLPAADDDAEMPWALGYVNLADGLGVIPDIDALASEAWAAEDSPVNAE
jgi:chemotaxis signal transduction protein